MAARMAVLALMSNISVGVKTHRTFSVDSDSNLWFKSNVTKARNKQFTVFFASFFSGRSSG
jgi:hypothetical protein